MVAHICSRTDYAFYSSMLGAVSFDDRSKWVFAEENKMTYKLERTKKTDWPLRKEENMVAVGSQQALPECRFKISRRQYTHDYHTPHSLQAPRF